MTCCSRLTRALGALPIRALVVLPILLLAACASPGNVGLREHSSFAQGPATERLPLLSTPVAIADALARGGYVIYFRHGRTRYDQIDMERNNRAKGSFDLARCDTQRQLSDEGRAEMAAAGELFRRAAIPLDRAFTSRYCRAIESAGFFVEGAQPTDMLSGEAEVGKNPAQKARTVAFLSSKPAPGKNHFMMAHGGIFWEATGFVIQEGHAVVLDPGNLSVIVARLAPQDWRGLEIRR